MILFDNKLKIKWERDNPIESKMKKKKLEVQFLSNQILKDKIEKNQFKKGKINQQSRPGQI